jgi:hypothetical protein
MEYSDLEILQEIKANNEGNPRIYAWATDKLAEIEAEKAADDRDFTVEQLQACEMMTEAEFWNKIYEYAKGTGDQSFITEVEVRMENLELEDYFETVDVTFRLDTKDGTWTVTDTLPKCDPPCDNCACQN